MAKISLAVKYRPKTFDDMTEQEYIKIILENQIKDDAIQNAYLFTGPAGCGKTTSARIFANMINESKGNPIEIDAASNNGVEQVRSIIDEAKFKPIDSKYKVYILDECHMLSIGAWNAMLKLLEEPPKTTIFILCTTDPQKIPKTILSRVQRYDFQKISIKGIVQRLNYIVNQERQGDFQEEALEYIAKVSDGGMRDAISMLDKCLSFSCDITIDNVVKALGISDYNSLDNLLESMVLVLSPNKCIDIIEGVYNQGKDLKVFIKQFIQYCLDVAKYLMFNSYDYIQIPSTINLSKYKDNKHYFQILDVIDSIINLSNQIKYEQNPKVLVESTIILLVTGRIKDEA